jgi:hypothetical protein
MTFDIFWAPEGRCIETVDAKTAHAAKRKAPKPFRKYLGEIYVVTVADAKASCTVESTCKRHNGGCTR